jgi:hypothetical protein
MPRRRLAVCDASRCPSRRLGHWGLARHYQSIPVDGASWRLRGYLGCSQSTSVDCSQYDVRRCPSFRANDLMVPRSVGQRLKTGQPLPEHQSVAQRSDDRTTCRPTRPSVSPDHDRRAGIGKAASPTVATRGACGGRTWGRERDGSRLALPYQSRRNNVAVRSSDDTSTEVSASMAAPSSLSLRTTSSTRARCWWGLHGTCGGFCQ